MLNEDCNSSIVPVWGCCAISVFHNQCKGAGEEIPALCWFQQGCVSDPFQCLSLLGLSALGLPTPKLAMKLEKGFCA